MTQERLAFIISRNNLALSGFSKPYVELDEDEKMAIDEMMSEVPELGEE